MVVDWWPWQQFELFLLLWFYNLEMHNLEAEKCASFVFDPFSVV